MRNCGHPCCSQAQHHEMCFGSTPTVTRFCRGSRQKATVSSVKRRVSFLYQAGGLSGFRHHANPHFVLVYSLDGSEKIHTEPNLTSLSLKLLVPCALPGVCSASARPWELTRELSSRSGSVLFGWSQALREAESRKLQQMMLRKVRGRARACAHVRCRDLVSHCSCSPLGGDPAVPLTS